LAFIELEKPSGVENPKDKYYKLKKVDKQF
jgi:hypothetical protein